MTTQQYIISTKKYGDIVMLVDEKTLPLLETLPQPFYVSYYKNYPSLKPTYTNHPNSPFTGTFYVYAKNKKAIHRLITNCPDDMVVDHINHNTLDNTLANLKVCTAKQNKQNSLKAYTDTRTLSKQQIKQRTLQMPLLIMMINLLKRED